MFRDSPLRDIRTLEPSPCLISPPRDIMRDETSLHLMSARVGALKIRFNVFCCFMFTLYMVLLNGTDVNKKLPTMCKSTIGVMAGLILSYFRDLMRR